MKLSKCQYYQGLTKQNPKKRWAHINRLIIPKDSSHAFTQEKINEINNGFADVFESHQ